MRQLVALVPRGQGARALGVAREQGGTNLVCLAGEDVDGHEVDVVQVHVDNARLDAVVRGLEALGELRMTLIPRGVIVLAPPPSAAPEQVTDVTARSPLEVFLGGLQSIGSWRGFLGYAAAAGAVVWVGLHTNTVFLLTAAMLIAPFAGPAMTLALGTARGDGALLGRSLARYFAALALSIALAWGLSLVFGQEVATQQMVETSRISSFTFILPLMAGAAGALNLCQSERNSLVTAAGPGMLVAASLAPPAGMMGMAAAIGRWPLVLNGLFLLVLQLLLINLAGAVVFRLFGLEPRGVRYERGRRGVRGLSLGVTAAAVAALLVWQYSGSPNLERATVMQRLAALVQRELEQGGRVHPVQVDVRFPRPEREGQNTALITLYVQRRPEASGSDEQLRRELARHLQQRVLAAGFNVTPLVDVTVLSPP